MTDERDDQELPRPDGREPEELDGRIVLPSDPAGTRPRVDRDALLPSRPALVGGGTGAGAGRPGGADTPHDHGALAERPDDEIGGGLAAAGPQREAPHAARFQFILGALLAVGGIAIVGLVLLVGGGGNAGGGGVAWSSWKPPDDGSTGAEQIAEHVQRQYRLASGEEMALVTVEPKTIADYQLDLVVRDRPENGGAISRLEGDTLLYRVCGLGPQCALRGKASSDRRLLLQREAIELASYSFRYLRGVDHVVVFMPPQFATVPVAGAKKPRRVELDNQMVHYARADLERLLDVPLSRSLASPPPRAGRYTDRQEMSLVDAIADRGQFSFSLVKGNGSESIFVVLEKLEPSEILERQQAAAASSLLQPGSGG